MSNSGQRDTNPSSSRSIMAVKRRGCVTTRVYTNPPGPSASESPRCPQRHPVEYAWIRDSSFPSQLALRF
jgi:hypothetical protein